MPSCPSCGRQLQAVTLNPDTPPWLCTDCSRGWWQAELDNAASWRNVERDFGDTTPDVLAACEEERAAQHVDIGAVRQ